ncbi:MAG: hypothetical protein DMG51_14760 [Acidobacteria bacterium]|nr:MAG: hypothetical protein DMG51_14760 [Acidobacteriota bacterium]
MRTSRQSSFDARVSLEGEASAVPDMTLLVQAKTTNGSKGLPCLDRWASMDARWPLQSGRITVGRLIDVVSHSPYWKDTAIFVVEDDSQDGVDHVNDRRPYRHSGSDSVQFHSQSETAHHAECPGRHQAGKGLAEGGREVFSARTQPRSGHRRSEPAQPRDLVTDTHFSKPFPGEKRIISIRESCTWRPPDLD